MANQCGFIPTSIKFVYIQADHGSSSTTGTCAVPDNAKVPLEQDRALTHVQTSFMKIKLKLLKTDWVDLLKAKEKTLVSVG